MDNGGCEGARCHLEWGRRGAARAALRGDILAVCDVLSFSTAVVTACMGGARVYPCFDDADAQECAARFGAEIAVRREEVSSTHRYSLSPVTFLQAKSDDAIALPSPNGATCCRIGSVAPAVLIASLLNATAAARAASLLMKRHHADLTVLACGERQEPHEEGQLRFALEDYLGAGALLAALDMPCSPDAAVCRAAFLAVAGDLASLIRECPSGAELRDRGWPQDIEHAMQRDICDVVPLLADGWLATATF